ncbi:indole-3-acetic acid-induced protein ARG2 [Senna tora]|uniref:Indole-3-acetic acid-induced protein ARG2 n=1 Tax=Senna tora TaxID=362788 RepID=A0A834SJN8_9FABA|nr:indole-3-acetic acid-induced protein ARG2 [Senna tora]
MAASLTNLNRLSCLVLNSLTRRRGYAAMSEGVGVGVRKGSEDKYKSREEEKVSWVPDPVTGYYKPENSKDIDGVITIQSTATAWAHEEVVGGEGGGSDADGELDLIAISNHLNYIEPEQEHLHLYSLEIGKPVLGYVTTDAEGSFREKAFGKVKVIEDVVDEFKVVYIHRKGNACADVLAKKNFVGASSFVFLPCNASLFATCFLADFVGISFPREVDLPRNEWTKRKEAAQIKGGELGQKSLLSHSIRTRIAFPMDMNYLRLREIQKDSSANRNQANFKPSTIAQSSAMMLFPEPKNFMKPCTQLPLGSRMTPLPTMSFGLPWQDLSAKITGRGQLPGFNVIILAVIIASNIVDVSLDMLGKIK